MFFKDIFGHNTQKELVAQLVAKNKVPHAQIFFGPGGVGKLLFVRAFVSFLLCTNKKQNDSCGECLACIKTHKLIHPDVHFTFPTIGTNVVSNQIIADWRKLQIEQPFSNYSDWLESIGGENKQGNINKEECNQMIKSLGLKSFESKEKVWIIWGGEYLGKDGNRLLKLIEEPPENTYIIILVNDLNQLLGTIQSRCQSLKLFEISDDEVISNLERWSTKSDTEIESAGLLSGGNVQKALKILSEDDNPFEQLWSQWIKVVVQNDAYNVSNFSEDIAKLSKEQQKYFVQYAIFFMREVFVLKSIPDYRSKLNNLEATLAKKLADFWNIEAIQQISEELNKLEMGITRNGNIKILLFDTYLRIQEAVHVKNRVGSNV